MTKIIKKSATSIAVCASLVTSAFCAQSQLGLPDEVMAHITDLAKEGSPLVFDRAQQGDPEAMIQMGYTCELQGKLDDAYRWFKKASDLGHPFGQYSVAMFHFKGMNVTHNPSLAASLMEKFARQGLPLAEHMYGWFLLRGIGVEQNTRKAMKWLHSAADHNYPPAKGELGEIYWKGNYVKPNLTISRNFLVEGADAGDPLSQGNLGEFYLSKGNQFEKSIGWDLIKKGADGGDPKAMFLYATHLKESATPNSPLPEEALQFMIRSAMNGFPDAEVLIGASLLNEFDNNQQAFQRARRFLTDAAVQKHPVAMYYLGTMYQTGKGVSKDSSRAKTWFAKSCDAGYKKACSLK